MSHGSRLTIPEVYGVSDAEYIDLIKDELPTLIKILELDIDLLTKSKLSADALYKSPENDILGNPEFATELEIQISVITDKLKRKRTKLNKLKGAI